MFFERSFIDNLNNITPIADLMEHEGEQIIRSVNSRTLSFLCTRCNGDIENSRINLDGNFFKCFRCEAVLGSPFQGRPINYLQIKHGFSLPEAVEYLCDYNRIEIPKRQVNPKEKEKARLFMEATRFFEQQLHKTNYLQLRGISELVARKYRAGYAPGGKSLMGHLLSKGFTREQLITHDLMKESGVDKLQNRIIIPLTQNKVPYGFYSRRVDDGTVLKHWVVGGRSAVLGVDYLQPGMPMLDIYESCINKLAAESVGLFSGISIGGCTNFSKAILQLIARLKPKKVRIIFDADRHGQGQKMALDVAERIVGLGLGIEVTIVLLPMGEDVSSLVAAGRTGEFLSCVNQAMSFMSYRAHYLMSTMPPELIYEHMKWRETACTSQQDSPLSMLSYSSSLSSQPSF